MSKGGRIVGQIIAAGRSSFLPSAWYGLSASLRKHIRESIANIPPERAHQLLDDLEHLKCLGVVEWFYPLYQEMWFPGELAPSDHLVGLVGTISGEPALKYLRGELDEYGYRNWYLSDEYWATQEVA
jgi:hypothetical protein